MRFPEGVDLTGLSINYFLSGPFGGYGTFVRTNPSVREYVLETSHDGQPAKSIKAIIYCPGYQTVLFTREGPWDASSDTVNVALVPLSSVPLAGRVTGIADPEGLLLEIRYAAFWSHAFFGIYDGAVVSFKSRRRRYKPVALSQRESPISRTM